MDREQLKKDWLQEEQIAHIHGWDFSHLEGRWEERDQELPWEYKQVVRSFLRPRDRLLDIDTGGGEFLLSLGHPYHLTSVTEAYPPNVELCRKTLGVKGIDVRSADAAVSLPFEESSFDLVLDRHGSFRAEEIYRVLAPGGLFVTEQVGAENDREMVDLLLPGTPLPFPNLYADRIAKEFQNSGFQIKRSEEAFYPIRFFDVGALVWFARIIEWEFPHFDVERCLPRLYLAQERLQSEGVLVCRAHRFLLVARKP